MDETSLTKQLQGIQEKLDSIQAELTVSRRHREEMQELKEDLTMVAKD